MNQLDTFNKKKEVAIIGGGASGILCAIHLLEKFANNIIITIFEPRSFLGEGKAYSSKQQAHLLNVPIEKMSYHPDKPDDFKNWIMKNHSSELHSKHFPFVPRYLYAEYLRFKLSNFEKKYEAKVSWHQENVISIKESSSWKLKTESGFCKEFALCFGAWGYKNNLDIEKFNIPPNLRSKTIEAYQDHLINNISIHAKTLIVGSGLSAVDTLRQLRANGHNQAVFMTSRRGLLPRSHSEVQPLITVPCFGKRSPLQLLKDLKKLKKELKTNWPTISESIRPQLKNIWNSWDEIYKKQFIRHLKPYWEIARHRIPASIHKELENETLEGRLFLMKGKIQEVKASNTRNFQVVFNNRNTKKPLEVDHIIWATGATLVKDFPTFELTKSKIVSCSLGFGYKLLNAQNFFLIGPISKTSNWEITAIPDIRSQIMHITEELELKS